MHHNDAILSQSLSQRGCVIFETFRFMATKTNKLDPAQYYRLPGFSWDTMLRYTKVDIELKGKEFYNKVLKQYLKSKNIDLYSTENEEKCSVIERWNSTIKTQLWKYFTANGTHKNILMYCSH